MRPVLSLQYFPDVAPCSKTSIPFPWCAFAAYQVETLRILCRPHFALRSAPHCNVVSSHYFDSDTAASDCGSIYLRKMRVTLHIVAQVPFTLTLMQRYQRPPHLLQIPLSDYSLSHNARDHSGYWKFVRQPLRDCFMQRYKFNLTNSMHSRTIRGLPVSCMI